MAAVRNSKQATRVRPAITSGEEHPADAQFTRLYAEYYPRVVGLCRRNLGAHHDAEAVAQEAFIRAWHSWETFIGHRPFWPWVATIARRLCINERLAGSRRDSLHVRAAGVVAATVGPGDDLVDDRLAARSVRRALRRLSPRQQELLFLRDVEEWSYEQIAVLEGSTVEAVRGSLKRARAALRRSFERMPNGVLAGLGFIGRVEAWARNRVARLATRSNEMIGLQAVFGREAGVGALVALLALATAFEPTAVPGSTPAPVTMAPLPEASPPSVAPSMPSAPAPAARTTAPRPAELPPDPAASSEQGTAPAAVISGYGHEFVASPSYEDDRTVFASGHATDCAATEVSCRTLHKSTDGGATWQRLPAQGFPGGKPMLSPAYPDDPRMFATTGGKLFVSDDHGTTFRPIGPVAAGRASMSPLFSAGDSRILFGSPTGLLPDATEYDVETGRVKVLSLPLPLGSIPLDFAFSPSYREDSLVLVSAFEGQGPLRKSSLFMCTGAACRPALRGARRMSLAWSTGTRPTALAWDTFAAYRSVDGGDFRQLPLPEEPSAVVMGVTASPVDGRLYVTLMRNYRFEDVATYASNDGGESWERVLASPLDNLVALPDGTLLGSPPLDDGGGIRCSVDGGRSWAEACPSSSGTRASGLP